MGQRQTSYLTSGGRDFCVRRILDLVLWVGLELEDSRIGVLNIYAPIDLRRRVTFWRTLIKLLPTMDSWIDGGDFNNLETMEDQHGRGPEFAGITQAEQSAWETFLFAIGGRDSWRDPAFRRW